MTQIIGAYARQVRDADPWSLQLGDRPVDYRLRLIRDQGLVRTYVLLSKQLDPVQRSALASEHWHKMPDEHRFILEGGVRPWFIVDTALTDDGEIEITLSAYCFENFQA